MEPLHDWDNIGGDVPQHHLADASEDEHPTMAPELVGGPAPDELTAGDE
jgi:hypothetical protein